MRQKSAGVVHGGRVACSGSDGGNCSGSVVSVVLVLLSLGTWSGSNVVVFVLLTLPRRDGKPWFSHHDENREAETITLADGKRIEILATRRKQRPFMISSFFVAFNAVGVMIRKLPVHVLPSQPLLLKTC
jgi:hypothetical protein